MSIKRSQMPVKISEPDPESKFIEDRLHWAILRGKTVTVSKLLDSGVPVELANQYGQTPLFCASFQGHYDIVKLLLKLGADPNRRCTILCCTPVHAACWSGNTNLLTSLLIAGGDLRLHDQNNQSPRDWATMQPHSESQLATLSLIERFREASMKNNEVNVFDSGVAELNNPSSTSRGHRATSKLPTIVRNKLAAIGWLPSKSCEFIGPLVNVKGTGFGKILYGRGESAAALWPVPLINESEISDPDDEGRGEKADLNGFLPRGIAYRSGPTTEMIPRSWYQTPVNIRRMKDEQPPDLLFEELRSMSRLRHHGLLMLLGVCATQHWESVQLVYEPVYHGSLYHRLHIMGSNMSFQKRLLVLQQICEALIFLHSKGLLHCSVSSNAVHLVSTGRAKLGCLETLSEEKDLSNRAYRQVPSSHWEWMAPWLAPECARGEFASTLSDVYSFSCLVWETCSQKIPWSHLDSKQINGMWKKESCNNRTMLPLGSNIPRHIASFLKLGLQPELSERRGIDLQEIFLSLRLQMAAIYHSQRKEVYKKSSPHPVRIDSPTPVPPTWTSEIQPKHGWKAVKKNFEKRQAPPPPPPPLPPPPPGQQQILEVSSDSLDDCNAEINQSTPYIPMPQQRDVQSTNNSQCAIKPASHSTERHSTNWQSDPDGNTSTCHTPPSHRAQPAKMYREPSEFETWRTKLDEAIKDDDAAEESTVEVHPSSTSTPRHQHGVTFLACSSGYDDIGGTKPKRSLKFLSDGNHSHTSQVPSCFTMAKPSQEFIASLAAIFNKKAESNINHSGLNRKSTSTREKLKRD